jgi:hypothetical protein
MNVLIVKLGISTIIVVLGVVKLWGAVDSLYLAYDLFKVKDAEVLAVIATKYNLKTSQ